MRAFVRGGSDGGGGGRCVGGDERQSSDGAMFGNGWLPNIKIINNHYFNFNFNTLIQLKF
jgi:hypothetical protein